MDLVNLLAKGDWEAAALAFSHSTAMKACVQDPIHHAEGDVWTHTRMVHGHLKSTDDASVLTCLYHDVAKPQTRTEEHDGNRIVIRHPSHSRKGAAIAWAELARDASIPLDVRLKVYWTVMWHQKVFHMWSYDHQEMVRNALTFASLTQEKGRDAWQFLIDFARADNRGRICADPSQAETNLTLLEEFLDEQGLTFETDHARLFYFEDTTRSAFFVPPEPKGSHVYVMCGLPGAGKDTYITKNLSGLTVISLDAVRDEMGFDATDNHGQVFQAVKERARVLLRRKEPFVWNATNITRKMRTQVIALLRDYDAFVEIHALDRPVETIFKQNRDRARVVPENVIARLLGKFEPPSRLEAHRVIWR